MDARLGALGIDVSEAARKGIAGARAAADEVGGFSRIVVRAAQDSFLDGWRQSMLAGLLVLGALLVYIVLRGVKRGKAAPLSRSEGPDRLTRPVDDPERDSWQKPDDVIKSFDLPPHSTIVEIGAGTGYFTTRLAHSFSEGKVIAFEASLKMVMYLKLLMEGMKLDNVDVRLSRERDKPCLEEDADLILCVDVYHHLIDRVAYFARLKRRLKHGRRLVIVDRPADFAAGSPPSHFVSAETVKKELSEAGCELVDELDFLLPQQYYLAFRVAHAAQA